MNESLESHDHDHQHIEGIPTVTVALLAGICRLLFGILAFSTNSILPCILYSFISERTLLHFCSYFRATGFS